LEAVGVLPTTLIGILLILFGKELRFFAPNKRLIFLIEFIGIVGRNRYW
jgi:hypothetical protein